jgi:hypothetical protein
VKIGTLLVIVLVSGGWARVPAPRPTAARPSESSEVAPAVDLFDVSIAEASVVRARLIARDGACDKYCWAKVHVDETVTGSASGDIRVAYKSAGRGISTKASTLYLAPYRKDYGSDSRLWRLVTDQEQPLPPTATQVAASWAHAFRKGDQTWLAELTAMPFTFRRVDVSTPAAPGDVSAEAVCPMPVTSAPELASWLDCLHRRSADQTLSLAIAFSQPQTAPGVAGAPARLRRAAQSAGSATAWGHVVGTASGARYDLLLALTGGPDSYRVSTCLMDLTLSEEGRRERKRRLDQLALEDAVARDDLTALRKLLRSGVSADEVGNDFAPSDPPITMAAARGQLQMVDFLLSVGANPDFCCCECVTALDRAIEKEHVAVVERLLRSLTPRGRSHLPSALDRARKVGNGQIIRLLEDRSKAP